MKTYWYKATVKFNADSLNSEPRPCRIIVSLTSYPRRIHIVPYVIASMLNQSMKPDKIVLWLSESQFPDKKLPDIFGKLKACGVEVRFCPEDLRPHKKYFYAMQEYPDDIIITVDDDHIYGRKVIEELYQSYIEHPDCVSTFGAYEMKLSADGWIAPGSFWWRLGKYDKSKASYSYSAIGVCGVLYPPHILPEEAFNVKAIKTLCLKADDMWLKFMELLNGVKVFRTPYSGNTTDGDIPGFTVFGSQRMALWRENSGGENERQITAILKAYNTRPDGTTLLDMIRRDTE